MYPLAWSPDGTRLLYKLRLTGDANLHYYVSRLWPAVRQRQTQVDELPSTEDVTAAAFLDNDTVIVARTTGSRSVLTVAGRDVTQLPAPVTALVAAPGAQHLLIVTAAGELWRWDRREGEPTKLADGVSAVIWLPWT